MSTMSYYSSAASSANRFSTHGVPSRCWCGEDFITFTSKTKDNPYRRFYQCTIALKRENEDHLFKWVDEALLEEIRMVEEKCKLVVADVNALKMEDAMSKKIEGEVKNMKENVEELGHVMAKSALKTVGVASVILCSIVWLWGRV